MQEKGRGDKLPPFFFRVSEIFRTITMQFIEVIHTKMCNLSKFDGGLLCNLSQLGDWGEIRGRLGEDGGGVLDGGEVEALGGGGIAGEGAVLAGDEVGEGCGGDFGIAYLE